MVKGIRYSEEFQESIAKQVINRNSPLAEVPERRGISSKKLYNWVRTFLRLYIENK